MAGSLNKVMIIGNVGRDPELRYLPSGETVANFSVAVGRTWKNQEGQQQEETEWFRVSVFGRRAEVANQYITKGKKIYVEGRLRTRSWDDPNTGEKKYATDLIANDFQFLDSRGGDAAAGGESEFGNASVPDHDEALDEIPF